MINQTEGIKLLTAKDLEQELSLSTSQVYNLLNGAVEGAEDFPAIRIGRSLRVTRPALENWLAKRVGY